MNANAVESLPRALPTRQPLPANSIEPRPLMPLSAVIWRLDRPENEVMALVEEGLLLWCFDVKEPKATRPAPRVLTQSVQDYLAGNPPSAEDEETAWPRVASLIFPDKPTMGTCELAQSLNCGRQHAMNLVYARQFRIVPGHHIRPGPGSPYIETASVKAWLLNRRML
jgi:hypothetical protein